jgi:acetyl esterase/lipase
MARWPSETFVGASAAACALTAISLLAAGNVVTGAGRHEPAIGISAQLEDRYPQQRTAFPDDVLGLADLIYASPAGFRPLTLDLYLPAQRRMSLPTIVFVHGGAWTGGHSRQAGAFENWPRVLASIAARGYVVASVNYRLSSEAVSPAAERDIKSAIAWLRANATRHAIDISRFGIWGASAGGQLAALAGTSCDVADLAPDSLTTRESVCVQAVATWYGVLDFAPLVTDANLTSPVARYLGCVDRTCSEGQVRLASPTRFIDASDPPFLLVHGARDRIVPVTQSTAFHAALLSAGVHSQLLVIDDVDHSFIGATPDDTRAASLRALEVTIDFFDCTLRRKICDRP